MPTNSIQKRKIRLRERALNEAEPPERRLRAARKFVLDRAQPHSARSHRVAKKVANLFISDSTVSTEVHEQAAKLLELVAGHAVNENEPDEDDEIPQIVRVKRPKHKLSLEDIRKGHDLTGHFWEVLSVNDQGFPATDSDFNTAKLRAHQTLLESGVLANRTKSDDEVFQNFKELVRQILTEPESLASAHRFVDTAMDRIPGNLSAIAEPEPPLVSPAPDYGVEVSLTAKNIVPRPDLSVPPELKPGEINARATCRICQAGGFALQHDCMMYQQDFS